MNPVTEAPLPGTTIDPRYPDSDGRPMGETDYHNSALVALVETLQRFFAGKKVYVAMNLMWYYKEGDPKSRRDPDVLIAKGVEAHRRRSFRVWEEKTLPCTLFEVVSKKTWRNDVGEKRKLYESLGIKEYFSSTRKTCTSIPLSRAFGSSRASTSRSRRQLAVV